MSVHINVTYSRFRFYHFHYDYTSFIFIPPEDYIARINLLHNKIIVMLFVHQLQNAINLVYKFQHKFIMFYLQMVVIHLFIKCTEKI